MGETPDFPSNHCVIFYPTFHPSNFYCLPLILHLYVLHQTQWSGETVALPPHHCIIFHTHMSLPSSYSLLLICYPNLINLSTLSLWIEGKIKKQVSYIWNQRNLATTLTHITSLFISLHTTVANKDCEYTLWGTIVHCWELSGFVGHFQILSVHVRCLVVNF